MYNKLKSKIYRLIYLSKIKQIDSKFVRESMFYYYTSNLEIDALMYVTNVLTFETPIGLNISIETHRPGVLIGKGGKSLDELKTFLKTDLKRNDITIDLENQNFGITYKNLLL